MTEDTMNEEENNSTTEVLDDLAMLSMNLNADLALADQYFYEDHDYETALKYYQKVAEEETDESLVTRAMYWIGETLFKLERIEEACEAFETLAQRFEGHHLGASARRRVEAIRAAQQALKAS